MSKPAPVDQTLRLLETLRAVLRDFSDREKRLEEDARQKLDTEQRRSEAAQAAENRHAESQREAREASLKEARARIEAKHRQRLARIRDAQRRVHKSGSDRLDAREAKHKFELQREMLRAAREREAQIAAADKTLAEFQQHLAELHHALGALEQRTSTSLGVYGRGFLNPLAVAHENARIDAERDEGQLATDLHETLTAGAEHLRAFERQPITRLSGLWALWLVLVLCPVPLLPVLQYFGITQFTYRDAIIASAGLFALGVILYLLGRRMARPAASRLIDAIGRARLLHHAAQEKALATHQHERQRIEADFQTATDRANEAWTQAATEIEEARQELPASIERRTARITERIEHWQRTMRERIESDFARAMEAIARQSQERLRTIEIESEARRDTLVHEHAARWEELQKDWAQQIGPLVTQIRQASASPASGPPAWEIEPPEKWQPPMSFSDAVRFGEITVELPRFTESLPSDSRLAWPMATTVVQPLVLTFPDRGSLLLETRTPADRQRAIESLNHVVLRLLTSTPPGRVSFTAIDPVGLGDDFAGLMHLADEAEHVIDGRIWTQTTQIEQRLADLNDHIEKVIQMYLRNEYADIAEYNAQAGNIAEKYHFVVIADFPAGFSDLALRRLASIVSSGPRCGVFTLIHWNGDQPLPSDFPVEALRERSVRLELAQDRVLINGRTYPGTKVSLDAPASSELTTALVQRVARANIDSNRVEVPFDSVAPDEESLWSVDTTTELRVPIGRTGATKLQYLAIGKGTRQHALIAGKTGSGKSTLFHVIITNLALWCSPDEVEFYLVDFKKGVEFKPYATHRLPHARVVAIESDREFGLSVLQRVDDELKRRGELFRRAGVQDLAGYRRSGGEERVPRVLLIIDEFQELFVEEDRVAQAASLLLDRIVRQGRAFGVHAILGSQTLGGAYTMARSTLGQMVIRIALQCNEADAYLIMDDGNSAPRLLSRPGEGIYNDAAGAREGNSPFQVVWLPEEVREVRLRQVRARADGGVSRYPDPFVFEGDAPGDVRTNARLGEFLSAPRITPTHSPRIWLGAPNSIKGPTEVAFERQSGDNLLIVGQREDAVRAMFTVGLVALSAQHPQGSVRFVVMDASPPGSVARDELEAIASVLPHPCEIVRPPELESALARLQEELETAEAHSSLQRHTTFLFVHELQSFKKLRQEDEFSFSTDSDGPHTGARFKTLVAEGPPHGFHVIAACDTYNNVSRFLGRKTLSEFGLRVLFQMSPNDSASLIDQPHASRLGLHRALLYQEREGYLEVFRPYSVPDRGWLENARRELARLTESAVGVER